MDIIYAYAKINLFLEVGKKRPDGYHDIDTVMMRVNIFDEIEIEKNGGNIEVVCDGTDTPDGENNIIFKVVKALYDESGEEGGAKITVHKSIPVSAGLGGGSSDAGYVLRYLNGKIKNPLSWEKLNSLAAKTGADVPYFLCDGVARAEGIGEKLSYRPSFAGIPCLLVKSGEKESTGKVYGTLDKINYEIKSNLLWEQIINGKTKLDDIAPYCFNRFEDVSGYCNPTLKALRDNGAVVARLSGSGSYCFGLFSDCEKRDRAFGAVGGIRCETV